MDSIDAQAVADARELLGTHLAAVDLAGLVGPLVDVKNDVFRTGGHRLAYLDAVVDLRHLLDEVRFEVALGAMIVWDFRAGERRGEVADNDLLTEARAGLGAETEIPLPDSVLPFWAAHGEEPPSPEVLLTDPHRHFGNRVLSTWFAGQLLDSAIFRSLAALDRAVALLQARAGRPELSGDRKPRRPTFGKGSVNDVADFGLYDAALLAQLHHVIESELFKDLVTLRHGFTHRRRGHFAAGGERLTKYQGGDEGEDVIVRGASLEDHINLAVGSYRLVVVPVVETTAALLSTLDSPDAA